MPGRGRDTKSVQRVLLEANQVSDDPLFALTCQRSASEVVVVPNGLRHALPLRVLTENLFALRSLQGGKLEVRWNCLPDSIMGFKLTFCSCRLKLLLPLKPLQLELPELLLLKPIGLMSKVCIVMSFCSMLWLFCNSTCAMKKRRVRLLGWEFEEWRQSARRIFQIFACVFACASFRVGAWHLPCTDLSPTATYG